MSIKQPIEVVALDTAIAPLEDAADQPGYVSFVGGRATAKHTKSPRKRLANPRATAVDRAVSLAGKGRQPGSGKREGVAVEVSCRGVLSYLIGKPLLIEIFLIVPYGMSIENVVEQWRSIHAAASTVCIGHLTFLLCCEDLSVLVCCVDLLLASLSSFFCSCQCPCSCALYFQERFLGLLGVFVGFFMW